MKLKTTTQAGGVCIAVKVVPGARRERIVGLLGDALKVAVSKPPEGGAANGAVRDLLAQTLGVPVSNVEIVRGHGTPRKQILIRGVAEAEIRDRLKTVVEQA